MEGCRKSGSILSGLYLRNGWGGCPAQKRHAKYSSWFAGCQIQHSPSTDHSGQRCCCNSRRSRIGHYRETSKCLACHGTLKISRRILRYEVGNVASVRTQRSDIELIQSNGCRSRYMDTRRTSGSILSGLYLCSGWSSRSALKHYQVPGSGFVRSDRSHRRTGSDTNDIESGSYRSSRIDSTTSC